MQYEKKYFGNGQGNFDDADFILEPNQWVNMENCRIGSTDKGVVGTIETIGSTVQLSSPEPSVTFVTIGAIEDEVNDRIIFFNKNLHGPWDRIVAYDIRLGTFYTVLLSSQVIGGLNFDRNQLITARIINGLLYWTDALNEPRKINIDAGIKLNDPSYVTNAVAYTAPIDWREITLIKAPPPLAPNMIKEVDATFANNFIANESFSFAFQYVYYDNETTVVGTYSAASRLNQVTDEFNRIVVSMDANEEVPQTVKIVNLVVRIGNNASVVKTWDKSVAIENTQIQNQNAGTSQLQFNFYNNITGPALASDLVLKPFDSVPLRSGTLEAAKNRMFLGNNVEGYDTPTTTSLTYTLTTIPISGGGGLTKNLIEVRFRGTAFGTGDNYTAWYVYITELAPAGYYAIISTETVCYNCVSMPPLPPAPSTVAVSGLIFRGATEAEVEANVIAAFSTDPFVSTLFTTQVDTIEITGTSVTTYEVFKSQSQYKIGVAFYDYAMRKCGVVAPAFNPSSPDPTLVDIPSRDFALTEGIGNVVWSLSNSSALTEIPEWAYYYCVVRTLNLRTRYFLQAFNQTSEAKYATKDADGNYVFTSTTFVSGAVGIAIDTTSLVQAGLGYVYTEGDVCYLITDTDDTYTLSVIDQSGKYIIVNTPEDGIGDFATLQLIYELYTPYRTSEQEAYYEIGEMYRVINPGTVDRQYETLTDLLNPDAYAITRNYDSETYFAEAMSPNDRFFNRWDNDAGKVNFIIKSGQQVKTQNISYSNVYIPGTQTNGLSTFEALNERPVPAECGPLQKLILTSKVQDEGDVMLAICTKETNSVYLGETQIVDSGGATQFLASSSGVIGTINTLKGSFGTINPESVVEFRGNVYWLDVLNGKVVQYSLNGLFPISMYKMTRFWKLFCEQYFSMSQTQIEALGSRPFIFTAVDPHHWELLITVPRVLENPPRGYLNDPNINLMPYPFDIWDGQAKTLVYKLNREPNFWQGAYLFEAEYFVTIENKLYSFKNGLLWRHNSTTSFGNFYTSGQSAKIMFISNQVPSRAKVYHNISLEVNKKPLIVVLRSEEPYQQQSSIRDFDWETREGVLYCQIYRNYLTPSATGLVPNGVVVGERMRTPALRVLLYFAGGATQLEFKFVNVGYSISLGHKT